MKFSGSLPKQKAFTVIELLVTLAIIIILLIIAIPAYMNYTRKTYYNEIKQAAIPYKLGVIACYTQTSNLNVCNSGTNQIPAAQTTPTGGVAAIEVTNGVIKVTPVAQHGITATDYYTLIPTANPDTKTLTWSASGAY
jgi:Tfp pilus assembly major pilin PilA